jgi:hypothetical protein
MSVDRHRQELAALLLEIKQLATRYYHLTGKPLGVTGEVAELMAAELLGLELCDARQAGFDAWDRNSSVPQRVQIKGRAVNATDRYRGRCPAFSQSDEFDYAVLVLLDKATLDPIEIHKAYHRNIYEALAVPGSKSRNERGSMGIMKFRAIGDVVWRRPELSTA